MRALTPSLCRPIEALTLETVLSGILDKPPLPFDELVRYGKDPSQFAELRFPGSSGPFQLLLVVHVGFWRSTHYLKHIGALCASLTSQGTITCSLEYQRLGDPGGGWPGTFQDIANRWYRRHGFSDLPSNLHGC